MADLSFTAEELETLRVALLSAYYNADDEERTLRRMLDLAHYEDEAHRAVAEHGRVQAALRAQRYSLLVERVMAVTSASDTPERPRHAESHRQ